MIDKPKGLVVHPAAGHATGTLVNALIAHCGDSLSGIGGVKRPGIVHRLDKDTTGLMVVAKTDAAHRALSTQFADKAEGPLERGYLAFVWGAPSRATGTIDAPLDRHAFARDKRAVRAGGRHAVTHWQVLERYAGPDGKPVASLLACTPRDRPHPPDPRASRPYRPSDPGRRHLRHRLQDQGQPACPRRPAPPWRVLADRPCMPIYWSSNTPLPETSCDSGRNFRPILRVCVVPWRKTPRQHANVRNRSI